MEQRRRPPGTLSISRDPDDELLDPSFDDDNEYERKYTWYGDETGNKSAHISLRVDPDMFRRIRRAALASDRKPADLIRRAINFYLKHKPQGK